MLKFFSHLECAEMLGTTPKKVLRAAKRGKLPPFLAIDETGRVEDRVYRVEQQTFNEWCRQRPAATAVFRKSALAESQS